MKSNYKTTSTTPRVNRETNLIRPLTARLEDGTVASLTVNLEYQMKSNYKTTSTTPRVNRETNLMRSLTARLENG